MQAHICATCGAQFPPAGAPPAACPICVDERQYVGAGGQRWTTSAAMRRTHRNAWSELEPGLLGIGTMPSFAIGQRALLIRSPGGNVLWDCISLIDEATVTLVRALGGISAIAISHPHFYTGMVDWADAFDAEIVLHAADQAHVMRPSPRIRTWSGPRHELRPGLTLLNAPGHFDGGTMLHWAGGAGGQGALLTGDIIQVVPDRRHVSFMRSYPNLVPVSAATVRGIVGAVEPYAFARLYGGWWDRVVAGDAKAAIARSAARYIAAVEGHS